MLTYDFHQHLWPPAFTQALERRSRPPFVRGDELVTVEGAFGIDRAAHDPARRLAMLDRDGIDVAVLSLQPTLGVEGLEPDDREELEGSWREGMREVVAAGDGRFVALAPWRLDAAFAGVSVGASALAGEVGAPVLVEADAAAALVFVHPEAGGPIPPGRPDWWQWTAGYSAQMQGAYLAWLGGLRDLYPHVRIVFAMLAGGAPIHHERLVHRGVHVRTSLDPNTLFETASYGRRAIELCIETFGVERLVYGSDIPVIDPAPTLDAVRSLGGSIARFLQSDTPERLLDIAPAERRLDQT